MEIETMVERVEPFFGESYTKGYEVIEPVDGLMLLRCVEPTPLDATLYEPIVCLILQGAKETIVGNTKAELRAGRSLVVSHDLPIMSRITVARPEEPYLAMILSLDVALLRGLYDEVGEVVGGDDGPVASSLAVHEAEPRLMDVLARYLELAHDPLEAKVLLAQVRREVHFRLLVAPHGGMLRRLLRYDSHASSVASAIDHIREHFRGTIPAPELARVVGMSTSALYKHFKQVTSTTPLQYQKELRLLEARKLLRAGVDSVSSVAYDVGYESPNQFSREYSRKFGVSPRAHLASRA